MQNKAVFGFTLPVCCILTFIWLFTLRRLAASCLIAVRLERCDLCYIELERVKQCLPSFVRWDYYKSFYCLVYLLLFTRFAGFHSYILSFSQKRGVSCEVHAGAESGPSRSFIINTDMHIVEMQFFWLSFPSHGLVLKERACALHKLPRPSRNIMLFPLSSLLRTF